MHLALICDDYLPDSTRVSAKMMHELALQLLHMGHRPIIFCPNCKKGEPQLKIINIDGIEVYKFANQPIKDVPKIKRAINESLLSRNAWQSLSKIINSKKIDGIIYYSPSIFFGPLVKKIKKKWNCPSYLILRDSFPQWLIDQDIIKENSLTTKYLRFFEKINYTAADYIGLMSEKNHEIFSRLHPEIKNIEVIYNWADIKNINNVPLSNLRYELSIKNKIIFFYGGNIGHAQDMSNIMRLTKSMAHIQNAYFLLIGQGDEVPLVKKYIEENQLKNCTYLPSISQDQFKSILKIVDIGLFSLAKSHTAHNFPGKILGYMANKLPILGSVNNGNDLSHVINNAEAGYVFCNGEDDALLQAAISLAENDELRKKLGENALALLKEKFSVESAATKIEKKLTSYITE
ncbi:glycosyltransferase family 4 protein [Xenorhabdus bovienii]|uniref:Glycosyl transferase WbwH n=1 Tax=Xenorhabdus bovienii TaxID=40576 RepID=A0A0B6XDS5_XENBV|nr:glycosyltransferase family 4 protein [Xenorhabdus bovienii]CDG86468.1 WbwH [Xenorhabdus bovienii str. feltiae France]CDG90763.1 WbwH [Xenorhabdus bovienii str. feltiae Florida]CDM92017.1 Glycosyl transferase WbwH [Xenorhabdus bovienii]